MNILNRKRRLDQKTQAPKLTSVIDLDRLLADISPEAPSGEKDLKGDEKFVDLESAVKGTPEIVYGGKIAQEAKDPNWHKVQKDAVKLLIRTHDLRVAMFLTLALTHTKGVNGLNGGLALLRGLVERYWDSLYPRLDPEDNHDPTERNNILAPLYHGEDITGPLMRTNMCTLPAGIGFNLRDVRIANRKLIATQSDKKPSPSLSNIEAAFKDSDLEDLQTTKAAIDAASDNLNSLSTGLEEKIGSKKAPDFNELSNILEEMSAFMKKQLDSRLASESSKSKQELDTPAAGHSAPDKSSSTQTDGTIEMINNRQDVIQSLDQICTYYQQNEPGSPVPLLLKRARGLVKKDFFEIMQDFGLDTAAPIKTIFNEDKKDKS